MQQWLMVIPVLLFSVVVHECAHGLAAERCGDPTARMLGRITLNPVPHIDPVGSILVPVILLLTNSSIFFAWARPVPVNPYNYRNPRRDDIIVSVAGPVSNLLLAFVFSGVLLVFILFISAGKGGELSVFSRSLIELLRYGIWINLILAFFNLIPIPPLDGSHILRNLLSPEAARKYDRVQPYGFLILLAMIYFNLLAIFFLPARLIFSAILKVIVALSSLVY
ncbi:MAG: site-2 protease family protein [Gemmatimonadota bacterium]|nr:site-2 protease family protein [Gemmatimonadota bacterium]